MKFTRMMLPALALGAVLTTPSHAVPVVFDLSGTVAQHGIYDYSSGTWVPWDDLELPGKSWSAQFIVETDLFGPLSTGSSELARFAGFLGLPGGVTPSLTIDGEAVEIERFNTTRTELHAADSNGFIPHPGGGWSLVPDQWGVSYRSSEVTPQGTTDALWFQMGFTEFADHANMTGGDTLFSFEDITSPLALAMLPIPTNPLWFQDVELTVENYACAQTCSLLSTEYWYMTVTSVTRTVGTTPVPEPGTLALLLAALGGALALRRRQMI